MRTYFRHAAQLGCVYEHHRAFPRKAEQRYDRDLNFS